MFLFLWRILGIVSLACLAAVIHRSYISDEPEVVFVREGASEVAARGGSSVEDAPVADESPAIGVNGDAPQPVVVALVSAEKAWALYEEDVVQFIDARRLEDFQAGHLPDAVHLPLSSFTRGFPEMLSELIPEVPTLVYCEGGDCESSLLVARRLVAAGFESVMVIEEGYPGWVEADYAIETSADVEGQ